MRSAFIVSLVLLAPLLSAQQEFAARKVALNNVSYSYSVLAPKYRTNPPAILLLHGAGGNAASMLAPWKEFARSNEILLIAPELPRQESFEQIAPQLFREIVEAVKREWGLDSARVYVFGHSMGGYLAFDAAMFDSDIFAAAAIHASSIDPDYVSILDQAKRKIPIALYIGDQDPLVPLARVRATRDLLQRRGFPLHYVELPGHDHNYEAVSKAINADAWKFFRKPAER